MTSSSHSAGRRPAHTGPAVGMFLLAGLMVVAVSLQVVRDRIAGAIPETPPTLWLDSPTAARKVALSFTDLAADVYWIRAVIHFGGERHAAEDGRRFVLLYPLLDMATTLDLHFDVAARLGAIFLSEGYPGGPGRPDQAIQLLEKGLANEPDRWQYRHDIGFVNYWWLHDFPEAARQFEMAAAMPGGPPWMRTMAAVTLTKGGDRDSARRLWTEMLAVADVDWIKRTAEFGLQQLRALDDLDALTARVADATARLGRTPATWQDVVAARVLADVPTDPTGVAYVLAADGRVTLDKASRLNPLPAMGASQ